MVWKYNWEEESIHLDEEDAFEQEIKNLKTIKCT